MPALQVLFFLQEFELVNRPHAEVQLSVEQRVAFP